MNAPTCVLIVLGILTAATASDIANCDFYDTVDLTGIQEKNGSYTYKNVEIPSNKIEEYNYTVALFGSEMPVDKHVRGCLCQVAKCVYFCCEPKQDLPNAYAYFSRNETNVYVNALEKYVVQTKFRLPCENFYIKEEEDSFTIRENGSLTSYTNNRLYSKKEYCLVPVRINNTYYELRPTIIKPEAKIQTIISFLDILRSVSIFCMIMTISVYIYLPKFRNDYSNSCLCYFICLALRFTLEWAELRNRVAPTFYVCYLMGYCGYFAEMAMFLWLLVINYELWRAATTLQFRSSRMFRKYNIFVWSVATTLLAITGTMEFLTRHGDGDSPFQPGVGNNFCWINTFTWSAMVYLYGPILVMLTIIIVLSFVSVKCIYVEYKKNQSTWSTSRSQPNAINLDYFAMFFRFVALSGVLWIIEIFTYIFPPRGILRFIDYIPCSQGILLFIVTIWKKDVFKALYEKMANDLKK